jgi:two-component system, NarL family, response regulator
MTKSAATTSILIADDHPVVREGLRALIARRPDMTVVAEASNGREALDEAIRHRPDVALLDLRMPELEGADLIGAIVHRVPETRIVVLSTFAGDEDIYAALRAGAKAYMLKDSPRDDLLACIRAVCSGNTWISPTAAATLATRVGTPELTPREKDVLRLMAGGKSNREIGAELRVAEGTVKAHVSRIFGKLNVTARTEAVTQAVRRGLVHLDHPEAQRKV